MNEDHSTRPPREPGEHSGLAVLLLHENPRVRSRLGKSLGRCGYDVIEVATAEEGRAELANSSPQAAVVAIEAQDDPGMALLEHLGFVSPQTPVFCISSRPDWEICGAAIQRGARDFLKWPRDLEQLIRSLEASLRSLDTMRAEWNSAIARKRREQLTSLILAEGGNITRVAGQLGCSRKTVYAWCRRYGIRLRNSLE